VESLYATCRRNLGILAAFVLLITIFFVPGRALFANEIVPKGTTVVVKVPLPLWHPEVSSVSTGTPIFSIDATGLLTRQDWQTVGLPYFGEFVVTKVTGFRPFGKLKYTDVELRNPKTWVKLRFQPGSDISRGFQDLTFDGTWNQFEGSDYFKSVVFGKVGSAIFSGPLSQIPDAKKLVLLRIAGTALASVSSESFKDKVYIGFAFPLSGTVYNSLKLNEGARTATVLNSQLDLLKSLAVLADTVADGVKIEQTILYRDFASENAPNSSDRLQVYAPLAAIKQFASADITSQQFIDQCVVILNSNRIQVLLSNGS
jgi:hypothetical protein